MTAPAKRNRPKRKQRANQGHGKAATAFSRLGGVLSVTDAGKHWTIRFTGCSIARVDWWPSTGKVVVNCHYGTATRKKTWRRLVEYVKERLAGKKYSSDSLEGEQ